jgi:hypothetical protein
MNRILKLACVTAAVAALLPMTTAAAQPRAAGPVPPPPPVLQPPTAPALPLEYAVKFVCGRNVPTVPLPQLATGFYFTIINIHNPNIGVELTWKVSLAALDQAGLMTAFQPFMGLKYDQSMDLDCNSIRKWLSANTIPVPPLFTGFVVIQANRELDVVAVYTAAPQTTGQVETLHSERVPVRKVK